MHGSRKIGFNGMATTKLTILATVLLGLVMAASSSIGQTRPATNSVNPNAKAWIPIQKMCTSAPKSDWLTKEEFLLLMKHRGYVVQTFRIVYESCYEVYGFDKNGRIVEAYFNPENARMNRQNNVNDK
jgi:hypothetical protein